VHISFGDVPARLAELDRQRRIAVICRSGNRSARVTEYLQHLGLHVHNMDGGLKQWGAHGLPVTAHDGRPGLVA
jgi:rhodanese-related sulfurtransferase